MNFEQSKLSDLPISPSISAASSPNLTQYPLSVRDTLDISDSELDLLQQQCNLRSIPLMGKDQFFKFIQKCLDDNPREELEARLRLSVNEEIARVHEAYTNVKHDFATLCCELLQTNEERFQFTKGLRDETIYGFELLFTCIFPILKRAQDKPRRERTSRKTAKPARGASGSSLKVSKNGVRQTARISRGIPPRRSARIEDQKNSR